VTPWLHDVTLQPKASLTHWHQVLRPDVSADMRPRVDAMSLRACAMARAVNAVDSAVSEWGLCVVVAMGAAGSLYVLVLLVLLAVCGGVAGVVCGVAGSVCGGVAGSVCGSGAVGAASACVVFVLISAHGPLLLLLPAPPAPSLYRHVRYAESNARASDGARHAAVWPSTVRAGADVLVHDGSRRQCRTQGRATPRCTAAATHCWSCGGCVRDVRPLPFTVDRVAGVSMMYGRCPSLLVVWWVCP
jgi:hypothetical protein